MTFVKSANLALSFFLELCLLAALGYWGFTTGSGAARYLLCLGIPLLAALTWGIFMAPASPRRLRGLAYQVLGLMLFGLAILALYMAGQPALALIFIEPWHQQGPAIRVAPMTTTFGMRNFPSFWRWTCAQMARCSARSPRTSKESSAQGFYQFYSM